MKGFEHFHSTEYEEGAGEFLNAISNDGVDVRHRTLHNQCRTPRCGHHRRPGIAVDDAAATVGIPEALASAGLDPDDVPVYWGDYRQHSGRDLAKAALDVPEKKRPTGLLCAHDLMAVGVFESCRTAGISVPKHAMTEAAEPISREW
jgi:hypothetical protein